MLIKETWLNATENHIVGDSGEYETYTDNIGELFKFLQKEYGRCRSKIYIDKKDGSTVQIGWVFQKKMKYTDTGESYIGETWIECLEKKSETTIQSFPMSIN